MVPQKVSESLLIAALKHESYEMPPRGKLADNIIEDFVKWVERGAPDPREGAVVPTARVIDYEAGRNFWAFSPLRRTDPPEFANFPQGTPEAVKSIPWADHPIDRFIVAKQIDAGLWPSPLAEPRVLIRRAWFDLLGIPPTPDEMETWIARLSHTNKLTKGDAQPPRTIDQDAWRELVDTLLKRPEYGERWARHWMDIARFAESHGYEQDYDRPTAYFYRDFLIRALNQDLPYDKFVQWQIAGDELATENPDAWMATGFLGAGAFPTQLTEAEFESARYDELDDMVATTGVAFLGLSLGCARCHDHKFDPIGSQDYYRMAATFTRTIRTEKEFDLEPEANERRRRDYEQKLAAAQSELRTYEQQQLRLELLEWLKQFKPDTETVDPWAIQAGKLTSSAKTNYELQPDGSWLAKGNPPNKDTLTWSAQLVPGKWMGVRLEALSDASLPRKGPGRAPNGNFVLSYIDVTSISAKDKKPQSIKLASARASFEQNPANLSIVKSLEKANDDGWAVDGEIGKNQAAVFTFDSPLEISEPAELQIKLVFQHSNPQHVLGRLRLSLSGRADAPVAVGGNQLDEVTFEAIKSMKGHAAKDAMEESVWKTEVAQRVEAYYKTQSKRYQTLRDRVASLEKAGPGIVLQKVLVASEGLPHLPHHADSRGFPHFYPETYALRRGDVQQKIEVVQPGMLRVLTPVSYEASYWKQQEKTNSSTQYDRAGLAQWLTDTKYGAGALAARVMVNRLWQHHFGRGIVATPNDFGASGEAPSHPELLDWLAAELVDQGWSLKTIHHLMMTSRSYQMGTRTTNDPRTEKEIDNRLYWYRGPVRLEGEAIRDAMLSVSGQLDSKMFGPGTLDENMKRRSVYFFIKRSQLIGQMMLFDWPEHLVSIGQRPNTTIAPQALMFINSPQGRTLSEAFAKKIKADGAEKSINQAYRWALGRTPTSQEVELAQQFLASQMALRQEQGEKDAELHALADFCQMVMSFNEFVYVD